ncbi:MAG: protein kinase, partial [Thermoanaerobaculia bacterium]
MPLLSKEIEEKYEVLEEIASGGMGSIYKVRHRLLHEERVIKVMRTQTEQNAELQERFIREARFAIRLRHQNIAQLYDFSIDQDETYYIVMEYIQGMNLEEILKTTGPPKISLALEIGRQSLRALAVLHHQGFVHRDVSPDNLMLTQDLRGMPLVKLIDLGIAKPLAGERNLTQKGLFMGKVRYASPEHFGGQNGDATVEARSDLYSFGIVLYELLTGRYPVSGTNISSIVAGHLFQPPLDFDQADPDGRVPPGLRAIVLKSISKSLTDRYASAEEFSQALQEIQRKYEETEGAPSLEGVGIDSSEVDTTPAPAPETPLVGPGEPTKLLPAEEGETVVQKPKQIEQAAQARQRERLADAVQEIGGLLDGGSLTLAGQRLQEVERQFKDTDELPALRQRFDELLALRQKEAEEAAKRAKELADAVIGIQELLERGDLAAAEGALTKAEHRFQDSQELVSLRESLGVRRQEVEQLLAEAQGFLERREFDAAIERLQQALKLDGSSEQTRRQISEARSAAKRAHEMAALLGLVRDLMEQRKNLKKAARALAKAERKFPEGEELPALRAQLEELKAEEEVEKQRAAEAEVPTAVVEAPTSVVEAAAPERRALSPRMLAAAAAALLLVAVGLWFALSGDRAETG